MEERQILWSPWMRPGLEHLRLLQQPQAIIADGLILGVYEHRPFRVHYEIHCTIHWSLRSVHVSALSDRSQSLSLLTDGEGTWTTESGEAMPLLQGCLDVDISLTPFTNTLPIRRLALQPASQATLTMAYIAAPQMQIEVTQQRYTCLEVTPSGGRYRFESLEQGVTTFMAELAVDQDGLVLEYPGLFRRTETIM
jgi:uncharacterized protein